MSQENVEIVRRLSELRERRDWRGMTDLVDPNVELHGTVGGLEEGKVLRGLSQSFRPSMRNSTRYGMPPDSSPKSSSTLATGSWFSSANTSAGRAGSSSRSIGDLFDLQEGRVVRMQGYMNRAEALEAAGLSE